MANWANPTLTSNYANFVTEVKARDEDLAKMFDGQTVSNLPTGAIRWSSANNRFEKWSGSAWGTLSAAYAFTAVTTNGSIAITPDAAHTAGLTIGNSRTSSGYAVIDLIGDTTYQASGYSFRVVRDNTGANAATNLYHRGTGRLNINAQDSNGTIALQTQFTDRLIVNSFGNIIIPGIASSGYVDLRSSSAQPINGFYLPAASTIGVYNDVIGDVARWTAEGQYLHGTTSAVSMTSNTVTGLTIGATGEVLLRRSSASSLNISRSGTDGAAQQFYQTNTLVGSISVTTTATAYNTSSDYRLKENVAPIDDPIALLMQLKPCGFNFKAEPSQRVNGFIAHELADVIHEAVTGEKDAEDEDGNPIYQGVDQAKLVPVLTAAMQELVERMTKLEQPE